MEGKPDVKSHPRWRMAKKILTSVFIAVGCCWFTRKKVDWEEVWESHPQLQPDGAAGAAGLVIAGHLMYAAMTCWAAPTAAWLAKTPCHAGVVYLPRL